MKLCKFIRRRSKENLRHPALDAEGQGYVFRRSRTLTGTTSPKVTAGAQQRSQLKTARLQTHELHQLRLRILQILGGLLAGIAVLSYLLAAYIGHVSINYPQPGRAVPAATYQQFILDYFARHPLERFSFALNQKQFSTELQTSHPEVMSVDINKNWFGAGTVFTLQFRKPLLAWETAGKRFYVDDNGVAFVYDHSGGSYVAVSDQSGISPDVTGGVVASDQFIHFLGKMVGSINAGSKGTVIQVIVPSSSREVDIRLQGRGYTIKTHTDRDPAQEAQDIVAALTWFDAHKITPQYVDARVSGKVYYK